MFDISGPLERIKIEKSRNQGEKAQCMDGVKEPKGQVVVLAATMEVIVIAFKLKPEKIASVEASQEELQQALVESTKQ